MKAKTHDSKLPAGILVGDLKYPHYEEQHGLPYEDRSFELWFTASFGWCIPTLLISSGRRQNTTDRTYAVTVNGAQPVRIGKGPHVSQTLRVYVRKDRLAALQPYLDLRRKGAAMSGEIRDRISSRRAKGAAMRAAGRTYWRWDEEV